MHPDPLQKKLIAAARANPPADQVPFAFEKRVMARLAAQPAPDIWTLWSRELWRGAMGCLAVVVLLGALSFFVPRSGASGNDLSQDFVNTMMASVDQDTDSNW